MTANRDKTTTQSFQVFLINSQILEQRYLPFTIEIRNYLAEAINFGTSEMQMEAIKSSNAAGENR